MTSWSAFVQSSLGAYFHIDMIIHSILKYFNVNNNPVTCPFYHVPCLLASLFSATIFFVLHLGLLSLISELIFLGALTSFVTLATSGRWSWLTWWSAPPGTPRSSAASPAAGWGKIWKTRRNILSSACLTKYNLCTLNALWRQLEGSLKIKWRNHKYYTQTDGQTDRWLLELLSELKIKNNNICVNVPGITSHAVREPECRPCARSFAAEMWVDKSSCPYLMLNKDTTNTTFVYFQVTDINFKYFHCLSYMSQLSRRGHLQKQNNHLYTNSITT